MKKLFLLLIILFQSISVLAFQSLSEAQKNSLLLFPKDISNHDELINKIRENGSIYVRTKLFYDTEVSINTGLNANEVYKIYLSLFENLTFLKCFPDRNKRIHKREEVSMTINQKCLTLLFHSPFIKEIWIPKKEKVLRSHFINH